MSHAGLDPRRGLRYLTLPNGAQVAQLVEHAIENRSVGGSTPPLGTIPSLRPAPHREGKYN